MSDYRYFMLHKGVGCVSACRDDRSPTVMDAFPEEERPGLFPMGRLDKYTSGILILTDDGKLNRRLLNPENHIQKRYLLWAAGTLTEEALALLRSGVTVEGRAEPLHCVSFQVLSASTLGALTVEPFPHRRELVTEDPEMPAFLAEIVLSEGKRHQIRRMLEEVGAHVVWLKRTHFGALALDEELNPGEYRPLTAEEVELLKKETV